MTMQQASIHPPHATHEQRLARSEEAEVAGVAAVGALRAFALSPIVLIGLLVCPPLAILAVMLVITAAVTALVLGVIAALIAPPYLLAQHVRGHRGHASLLARRIRHAGGALFDLAPHRIAADASRLQPSP